MPSKTSAYSPSPLILNYNLELDDVRTSQVAGGFPSSFINRAQASNASLEVNLVGPNAAGVAALNQNATVTFIFEELGGTNDLTIAAPVAALAATNQTFTANIAPNVFPQAGLFKVLATISLGVGAAGLGNGYVESGVIEVR